ncbi:hypothetical protein COCNU_scaffold024208G000070 [Cocos nucifera]|nr:hypothetical protein [Cocos nucifera]
MGVVAKGAAITVSSLDDIETTDRGLVIGIGIIVIIGVVVVATAISGHRVRVLVRVVPVRTKVKIGGVAEMERRG